jgi:hypothetical protein
MSKLETHRLPSWPGPYPWRDAHLKPGQIRIHEVYICREDRSDHISGIQNTAEEFANFTMIDYARCQLLLLSIESTYELATDFNRLIASGVSISNPLPTGKGVAQSNTRRSDTQISEEKKIPHGIPTFPAKQRQWKMMETNQVELGPLQDSVVQQLQCQKEAADSARKSAAQLRSLAMRLVVRLTIYEARLDNNGHHHGHHHHGWAKINGGVKKANISSTPKFPTHARRSVGVGGVGGGASESAGSSRSLMENTTFPGSQMIIGRLDSIQDRSLDNCSRTRSKAWTLATGLQEPQAPGQVHPSGTWAFVESNQKDLLWSVDVLKSL